MITQKQFTDRVSKQQKRYLTPTQMEIEAELVDVTWPSSTFKQYATTGKLTVHLAIGEDELTFSIRDGDFTRPYAVLDLYA